MAILSYVHEIQTVYNVVQNPQMILLSEKGAHGVSSECEKVRPANKTDHLQLEPGVMVTWLSH